jgi:hypothetical protein
MEALQSEGLWPGPQCPPRRGGRPPSKAPAQRCCAPGSWRRRGAGRAQTHTYWSQGIPKHVVNEKSVEQFCCLQALPEAISRVFPEFLDPINCLFWGDKGFSKRNALKIFIFIVGFGGNILQIYVGWFYNADNLHNIIHSRTKALQIPPKDRGRGTPYHVDISNGPVIKA